MRNFPGSSGFTGSCRRNALQIYTFVCFTSRSAWLMIILRRNRFKIRSAVSESNLRTLIHIKRFIASEKNLKKLTLILAVFAFCLFELPLHAQQFDAAFGLGTISSGAPTTSNGLLYPSEKGGLYPSISADFLVTHRAGIEGEFAWRGSQGLYGGLEPYRPIFWAINAIWVPKLTKGVTAELLG